MSLWIITDNQLIIINHLESDFVLFCVLELSPELESDLLSAFLELLLPFCLCSFEDFFWFLSSVEDFLDLESVTEEVEFIKLDLDEQENLDEKDSKTNDLIINWAVAKD